MPSNTQLMVVNGTGLTERDMFSAIDGVLEDLNRNGNINQAIRVLNVLDGVDNVTGRAKSKLLWGMNEWNKKNQPTKDFINDVLSSSALKSRQKALEYINVWEQIEQECIPKKIQSRPMRELIPIGNMLAQGYEPSKSEWTKIDLASNDSDLREIIREIKGKPPRKSGQTIELDRDGSLYTWKANKRAYVGFLDLESKDETVFKAIERIISGASIIRK